jgi:hypothetical protein
MTQLFFHCSNGDGVWIDRRIAPASDLTDAMEQAAGVVRALVMAPSHEDWRCMPAMISAWRSSRCLSPPCSARRIEDMAMLITFIAASTSLRHRWNSIRTRWEQLVEVASDPYRPELHYMRGPGPKWRAKHRREVA